MQRRNIGVLAHVDAGKTTITEWLLHHGQVIRRPGSVDAGTTVTDWLEEEQQRGITIGNSACRFKTAETIVTLIDTPGHVDFGSEVDRSLQVIDGGILVVSGYDGIQPQTETIWSRANARNLPCIATINKADKLQFSLETLLSHFHQKLGVIALPLEVAKLNDKGELWVLDVLSQETKTFPVCKFQDDATLEWLSLEREIAFEHILNHLALYDELLTERLLSGFVPESSEIKERISALLVKHSHYLPYQFSAGKFGFNTDCLLHRAIEILPSPEMLSQIPLDSISLYDDLSSQMVAYIYKTEYRKTGEWLAHIKVLQGHISSGDNIYLAEAIEPIKEYRLSVPIGKDYEDIERLDCLDVGCLALKHEDLVFSGSYISSQPHCIKSKSVSQQAYVESAVEAPTPEAHERMVELLRRAVRHDPSYSLRYDVKVGAFVVAGRGELHLQVLVSQTERELGHKLRVYPAKVREQFHLKEALTLTGSAEWNDVSVTLSVHLEPSHTIKWVFDDGIGEICREALRSGIEAGLGWDGQSHTGFEALCVRVSARSFGYSVSYPFLWRDAAVQTLTQLVDSASVETQEPWVSCQMQVPMVAVGRTLAVLQRKQISMHISETMGELQLLEGALPLATILELTTELRDISSGRTSWTYSPIGYRAKR